MDFLLWIPRPFRSCDAADDYWEIALFSVTGPASSAIELVGDYERDLEGLEVG
jgi:hypothetical protein